MVWFFEMPFEFDNVPLASLQIISLTPPPSSSLQSQMPRTLSAVSRLQLCKLQACL